jgi:hypothetical protein
VNAIDVRQLAAAGRLTVSVPEAGAILGLGRTRAFEMARDGSLPGIRRLGRRWIVSLPELCAYLGADFRSIGPEGVSNGNGAHPAGSDGTGNE